MNFVLVHLGGPPPSYLWDCIEQIRKFSKAPIYLYCAYVHAHEMPEVTLVGPVQWRQQEYESAAGWIGGYGDFWDYAFRRLFYVEAIVREYGLTDVIHIENDVLIYSDPAEIPLPGDRIYITQIGPKYASHAYCFIPNHEAMKAANDAALAIASEGKEVLNARYGEGMVNEMLIAKELQDKGIIGALPVLPDNASFGVGPWLFDGASCGQFLGGPPGVAPGWAGAHHFVGAEILDGRCTIEFDGSPRMVCGDITRPLHNLHVHNKDLRRWM